MNMFSEISKVGESPQDNYRYKHRIFDVCQDLHDKYANGDPTGELTIHQVFEREKWLAFRLESWSSCTLAPAYDECVRRLIEVTLAEAVHWWADLAEQWEKYK